MAYTPSYVVVIPNADVYTPSYTVNFNDEEDVQGQVAASFPGMVASVVGRMPVVGTLSAIFPPMVATVTARVPPQGKAIATFPVMAAAATGFIPPQGKITATFKAMTATVAGRFPPAGKAIATFPSMVAALTGVMPPQGRITATFPGMVASLAGETRETIRANLPFLVLGGNATVLEDPLNTVNANFLVLGANAQVAGTVSANFLTLGANAVVSDADSAKVNVPFLVLDGNASGSAEDQPAKANVGFLELGGNASAAGTVNANFLTFGANAKATDEDSARVNTSFLVIGGNARASDSGTAKANVPFLVLGASASTAGTANAPFLQLGGFASAIDLDALGAEARNSVAYAMNIRTEESTRFTNFGFDHIIANGDRYYGVRADGLYEVSFDIGTDYNGADPLKPVEINGSITTKDTDFGQFQSKFCHYLYVNSDNPEKLKVTPYVDGLAKLSHEGRYNDRKVKLSKKHSGRYWSFTIENIRHLQGTEAVYLPRVRRVK